MRLFIPACLTLSRRRRQRARGRRGDGAETAQARRVHRRRFVYAKQLATELERRTLKNNLHI